MLIPVCRLKIILKSTKAIYSHWQERDDQALPAGNMKIIQYYYTALNA